MLEPRSHRTLRALALEAVNELVGEADGDNSSSEIISWSDRNDVDIHLFVGSDTSLVAWLSLYQGPVGQLNLSKGEITSPKAAWHKSLPPITRTKNTHSCRINSEGTLYEFIDHLKALTEAAWLEPDVIERELHSTWESDEGDTEDEPDGSSELVVRREVSTESRDETIGQITDKIRRGVIQLQPDFQRGFVWKKAKSSALIESVLMNIPLPIVYLAERTDGTAEVVDGQQRLTTLYAFVNGKFPSGEKFRLGKLRVLTGLRGKTFSDLPDDLQNKLLDYTLRVIKLRRDSDSEVKFDVFERLNSGAEKLNEMELRNCIYRGSYNDLLEELSYNKDLLAIRGENQPHARMNDRQLILRFFAYWRVSHLNYKSPMRKFLNTEMERYRFAGPDEIERMRSAFKDAISVANLVFGEKAFRRFNPGDETNPNGRWEGTKTLNAALWDTILYTFSLYEKRQLIPIADAIREEFFDICTNDFKFIDFIGRTTDAVPRVRYRADAWRSRIDALVSVPENEARRFSSEQKRALWEQSPTCTICGQQILRIEDAEVDHIEHFWRGGATIPSNARLTHRYCNRKRGGRNLATE